ncbi:MAG: hypothetical protein AMJ92_11555 [candidate division Zixibacteria bacterium SM23_81]|nr:MAG: hypothetical protein AMJ92_11555 [candidate division Zixibacteria bacterium SM23_81]
MREKRNWDVFLSVLSLLIFAALSCSPKPASIVKSYQEAYNNHDLDGVLALYAEDASFEIIGQVSLQGKKQVRELTEYDFVLNIHMSCDQFRTRGDSVMCQLEETNDWLKASGIQRARYMATFMVRNGLIQSVRAELAPETEQAIGKILDPLIEWASQHRPELLAEMMPEKAFIYNADNAKKSLSLLHEWKEMVRRKAPALHWQKLSR